MKGVIKLNEAGEIEVEYDHVEIISPCRTYKRTLPLHPANRAWAHENIGREVEVEFYQTRRINNGNPVLIINE